MRLSVCIPVYNFDVRKLVRSLQNEITAKFLDAEIILIDDASFPEFREINSELKNSVSEFIFLDKNVGRSRIRNLFISFVTGDFLLFLDCDSTINSSDFLSNYISFFKQNLSAKVVYGGRISPEKFPGNNHSLRWKYAKEREYKPAELRRKNSVLSFQTNNFAIERKTFDRICFNENYNGYGYEDLIFAMNLEAGGITIFHIENPVENGDLEENEVFLQKVEESVASISHMMEDTEILRKMQSIKLIKAYNEVVRLRLTRVILLIFRPYQGVIRKKISKGDLPIVFLDLYKLLLLLKIKKISQFPERFYKCGS